ncbi:MAG: CHAT domain-containing protein [bacterium]|nr:CHAT domain-containing protein [bacterium]
MEQEFEELLALANSDPAAAISRAKTALDSGLEAADEARAKRVMGLANANLGDLKAADGDLEAALVLAEQAGDPTVVGEVQMTRAGVLAWGGDQQASLDAIDAAFNLLAGSKRAMAQAQRGGIHYRLGSFALARTDLDASIAALESAGELMWWGHAITNRGLLNAYEGDVTAARSDLTAAKAGYAELGHRTSIAFADQNLGWLALRSGDFPAALNFLDEAEEAFAELGTSLGQLWCDRAEALLAAHLAADAKDVALRAASHLSDNGLHASSADALIQAAQAALLTNDAKTATETARAARDLMQEQGRRGWVAFADYLVMRARAIDDDLRADDLDAITRAVGALNEAGLRMEAVHAQLLAATIATEAGDYEACRNYLLAASEARTAGPVELRAQGWVAVARLRLLADDRKGAAAAARAGLRVLDDYQAALGGTMARLHVTGHGAELASIGLRLAEESGSPRRLFSWMELTRAGALRSQPATQGRDAALNSHLVMFREADEDLRRATLNGGATRGMMTRRQQLQERVRDVALRAAGTAAGRVGVPRAADVLLLLDDAALVEFGESADGSLLAVVLADGRARKFNLGPLGPIRHEVDSLSIALRRLATRVGSEASRTAAAAVVAEASAALDRLVVRPLQLRSKRIIVVPVGPLYSVPWSLLPSLANAHLVVSPSAALWVARAADAKASRLDEASVIAGPRLEHSVAEVDQVANIYARAIELVEPTAGQAARAIDGAMIAHMACHGNFRSDNALFSSLEMDDGPLTVYDLEALGTPPRVMVLSACDGGANTSTGGHEVMGLATALLGLGTHAVVANVGLVPDQLATIDLMVRVHTALSAGEPVAAALAYSFPKLDYENPDSVAARAFVTFGA